MPPERRHFNRLRAELHVRQAEPAADDPAVAEQFLDLVRVGGRADVEILRPPLEQQIAHAAADEIRDVMVFVQPIENFERVGIDVTAGDHVLGPRDDGRLRHRAKL